MMGIDFINVFYSNTDVSNFTAQLFRLIAKADFQNRAKLARGFPNEVALYQWWMDHIINRPSKDSVMAKAAELEKGRAGSPLP